ncbi:MAG: hypothetical protein MJZ76_01195 [Bacteroidales bacterium]|nr:hypothetical protein [Bacteroidales bacterium]
METNEKKISEKAEKIVSAFVELSMGKQVGLFSGSIYKKLKKNKNFPAIKDLIVEHLQNFDGSCDSSEKLLALSKFRLKILNLYDNSDMDELQSE